jgi:hypothetical protein
VYDANRASACAFERGTKTGVSLAIKLNIQFKQDYGLYHQ